MHFDRMQFHVFCRLIKFNLHPTLATPMNCEDVQVGFILKPDMSDAELYPEHHGRTLQSTQLFVYEKIP